MESILSSKYFAIGMMLLAAAILIFLGTIVTMNYFNSQELSILIEGANQKGLDYEVVIHNNFTNDYSFNIKE